MHLYVHVPFCARRCSYCDFAIAVRRETPSAAFREAVLREWEHWRHDPRFPSRDALHTLYFGGGTPSRLDPAVIADLVGTLTDGRTAGVNTEITLETNPEDVTATRAAAWVAAGINRISLGVQSFDPAVLTWMHRTHSVEQVHEAVAILRGAGLTNVSVDLIYAVPEHLDRDWVRDLDLALALEPAHLSLYGLTFEPNTPLERWRRRGEVHPSTDNRAAGEYLAAHAALVAAGFEHYEVSNAARPGFRSRHNSAYWSRAPYLGLGPSAHSAVGRERWWNTREWAEYERRSREGEPLVVGTESLDDAAVRIETLYLGLRTLDGLPRDLLPADTRRGWRDAGWAMEANDRLILTPEGWLRLDALVAAVPDP
jgi:oxygen-independent coproporphyrinogen III oxidase